MRSKHLYIVYFVLMAGAIVHVALANMDHAVYWQMLALQLLYIATETKKDEEK